MSVSGTGEAGDAVSVVIGGYTQTTTITTEGTWSAVFPSTQIPVDGDYSATVSVSGANGATWTLDGPDFVIDLTPPEVVFTEGTLSVGHIENAADYSNGITIGGNGEAGASIVVKVDGNNIATTVAQDGTWSVTYSASQLADGEYSVPVRVVSTDIHGNVTVVTDTLVVDTETSVAFDSNQAGGDNVISGAEQGSGVVLTGVAQAGATVVVTFQSVSQTVTAGSDGTWSSSFSSSGIAKGTYDSLATVTATDTAGNTASSSHSVHIDTEVVPFSRISLSAGADEVVNAVEAGAGLTITGVVEAGSSVQVRFGDGSLHSATVSAGGVWSVQIPTGEIPAGENSIKMTAYATDQYGNTSTISEQVVVDTVVCDLAFTGWAIGGDGVMNANETSGGLTVNGTVEPNSTLTISLANGQSTTVTANASGRWSATFTESQLPQGEGNSKVTVTATDRAGNVGSIPQDFHYDTTAPGAPEVVSFTRDAAGLRAIGTVMTDDSYSFTQIDESGHQSSVSTRVTVDPIEGETVFRFGETVPDGSYLVINTADTAGNESSTLLIVDNSTAPTVDLDRAGLDGFDFSAIDLTFAPDAEMTITEEQLTALTGADHELVVKGNTGDSVTLVGGEDSGETRIIDGETYNVYSLGDHGSVLLDDDIKITTTI
jgi:hypothetical protein